MKNDDYLWDKTGPPEADVEDLEQLLGALRHKTKRPAWLEEFAAEEPLTAAPNVLPFAPRRRWWQPVASAQAVAAAVALCVLAGGLWLGLRQNNAPEPAAAVAALEANAFELPQPQLNEAATAAPERPKVKPARLVAVRAVKPPKVSAPRLVAAKASAPTMKEPEITPAEGRKAMADLALAMRVLNNTLNLAQRNAESRVIILPATATR